MTEEDFSVIPLNPYKLAEKYLKLLKKNYADEKIISILFEFAMVKGILGDLTVFIDQKVQSSVTRAKVNQDG